MAGAAKVIAMIGNKGGTGKTTLAVNLAVGLMRRGSAALLDLDPQRSASQWSRIGEENPWAGHVYSDDGDILATVRRLAAQYEYVLLDCPPSIHSQQTQLSLRLADRALVPVQPSPMDLWATVSVVQAVQSAQRENPALRANIVVNQLEAQTVLSRDIRDVIDEVGLAALGCDVRRRAIYRNAMAEGKTVFDVGGAGRTAAAEIDRLLTEVIES